MKAVDLPRFLANGLKADAQMRSVTFSLKERLAVVPVELVQSWKVALAALVYLLIVRLMSGNALSWATVIEFLLYVGAILIGSAVVPALLPLVPGRSFAFKGWLTGIVAASLFVWLTGPNNPVTAVAYLLLLPAVSAFMALNFTGCTTYTSLSGVKKEMRIALPLIIVSAIAGIVLQLYGSWRT